SRAATEQIASGLWRWTAPHLEWEPNATPDSLADWKQHVGSVLYETSEHTVFFDPLLPPHPDEFWRWADQHVAARRTFVLTTIGCTSGAVPRSSNDTEPLHRGQRINCRAGSNPSS